MQSKKLILIVAALLSAVFTLTLHAQTSAFTYQGRLLTANGPASGIYDLRFAIYDADTGGSVVGGPITNSAVAVTNGLFTTTVDFGTGVFNGSDRWLEISVRTNLTGSFSPLSPRQKLTPTPYAIMADSASNLLGILPAVQLSGAIANANLPSSANFTAEVTANLFSGTFSGSGAELTSLNASSLSSGTVPDARLSANVALLNRNQTFTGNQTFAGQVVLPSPTATIYSGGTTVLRSDFNNANFFVGRGAGNLIVSGTANTGVGDDALISDLGGGGNTANGFEALYDNTGGNNNTASGAFALQANTIGSNNVANGEQALYNNTIGSYNTAIGDSALFANTSGAGNTAIGTHALSSNTNNNNTAIGSFALYNNTAGSENTAVGDTALYDNVNGVDNTAGGALALFFNSSGSDNTANGEQALYNNTIGSYNTANGVGALNDNETGSNNVAIGVDTLYSNTSGNHNTAIGSRALSSNTSGSGNVANGYQALSDNTNGYDNTASGYQVLEANTSGQYNTASGYWALRANTSGVDNTANGSWALRENTIGSGNTASGFQALVDNTDGDNNTANGSGALLLNTRGSYNTAIGSGALLSMTNGSYNIAIGNDAGFNVIAGTNNIDIGNLGVSDDNGIIRIGTPGDQTATYLTGDARVPGLINSGSQTGTSEAPTEPGLVIRRINSTAYTAGSVIARSDTATLERDGSYGGLRISYQATPGQITIAAMGMDSAGNTINFYTSLNNPSGAGTVQVYSDAANVVSCQITFGNTYLDGHLTRVNLSRYYNSSTGYDYYWVGTVTSTYNQ